MSLIQKTTLLLFIILVLFDFTIDGAQLFSQPQTGTIAGLFLEDSTPCSLRINIHRGDNNFYFGKTESGKNGYYAFTNLPFGRYYLITHPAGVGIRMPLQWHTKKIEVTTGNPVCIMPPVDGFSVKILHPVDSEQIDIRNISDAHPLNFQWTPYNGQAEYEVKIFSTDTSQVINSGRISTPVFSFNGKFKDGSRMRKRLYRWILKVCPKDGIWEGKSKVCDLCIGDLCRIGNYEGKYVKLQFPKWYESTIKKLDLLTTLDKCYLLEKKLAAGEVPTEGPKKGEKQAFFYDNKISFAHSGQPVHFGKHLLAEGNFPFNIAFHEMAHNFQFGGLPGFMHLLGGEYYSKTAIYLGFSEGLATLANLYISEVIKETDVSAESYKLIKQGRENMRRDYLLALETFEQNGAGKERVTPDILDGMCIRLGDKYGWERFPFFFKIFLKNEVTSKILDLAGTDDTKRITILVTAFSVAFEEDLRGQFKTWDFPVNDDFYTTIFPMVKKCIL